MDLGVDNPYDNVMAPAAKDTEVLGIRRPSILQVSSGSSGGATRFGILGDGCLGNRSSVRWALSLPLLILGGGRQRLVLGCAVTEALAGFFGTGFSEDDGFFLDDAVVGASTQ